MNFCRLETTFFLITFFFHGLGVLSFVQISTWVKNEKEEYVIELSLLGRGRP